MNCPACSRNLSQKTVRSVNLDVCAGGCAGIWFDNFELKKFDEQNEEAVELLDIARGAGVNVDFEAKRKCPRCSMIMMRHLFSPKDKIEIDECPACAGIWLDAGELLAIRSAFPSETERQKAVQEFIERAVSPHFAEMRKESQEDLDRAKRIHDAFRLICPSTYLPLNW